MINNLEEWIYSLIDSESPIERDTQIKILEFLFDKFIQYNKDLLMINNGSIVRVLNRAQFESIVKIGLKQKFKDIDIQRRDRKGGRLKWNIKIKEIYDIIISVNQFQLLRYTTDLFSPEQKIIRDSQNSEVTVIGNKLNIKEVQTNILKKDYVEIVKDYRKHFKHFDELLNLIVDMRFAKDRKVSFLHLRVKSDWGKSFLSGLLKNLKIAFEVDYDNLMNKGANSIAPIQVRNSFVMVLDEFNTFSAEMKKLSHSFSFAPKFGMREDVELFLKILMSAEKSPSFSGGVDEQIINRVMVMDIKDEEAETLANREIYIKHGNAKYMEALERYAYLKISERVKRYLLMEKFEAHKQADIEVRKAALKYKMKDIGVLKEDIRDVITEGITDIIESSDMDINPKFKEIKSNIIRISGGKYNDKIFIKQPLKTFETIIKTKVSENEFKKMRYKISNFSDITHLVSDKTKGSSSINGKKLKGLIIQLEELSKKAIPVEYEALDGSKKIEAYPINAYHENMF